MKPMNPQAMHQYGYCWSELQPPRVDRLAPLREAIKKNKEAIAMEAEWEKRWNLPQHGKAPEAVSSGECRMEEVTSLEAGAPMATGCSDAIAADTQNAEKLLRALGAEAEAERLRASAEAEGAAGARQAAEQVRKGEESEAAARAKVEARERAAREKASAERTAAARGMPRSEQSMFAEQFLRQLDAAAAHEGEVEEAASTRTGGVKEAPPLKKGFLIGRSLPGGRQSAPPPAENGESPLSTQLQRELKLATV